MPESTTPESHRFLRRSIGVLLALGTMAAGNFELRGAGVEKLRAIQTVSVANNENCLLSTPVTVLCQTTDTVATTTTSTKPLITTTTISTLPLSKHEPAKIEASKGLQPATAAEIKYLGCISLKESTDNPAAFNAAGPYYGKYQFHRTTWDGFVDDIDLGMLAGVEIRGVEEPVQDYVALQFLRHGRNGEWGPNRLCKYLLNA